MAIIADLEVILDRYRRSFSEKIYAEENDDHDLLMDVFSLLPALKRENRQYWGRELGMCWQLLASQACKTNKSYKPAIRIGDDEPCDFVVDGYAVDTKYRIGSGDSGTLKKFKSYGPQLKDLGYTPIFLILREDNLPAAISACYSGGWKVCVGDASFDFIKSVSQFDLKEFLTHRTAKFPVAR